MMIKKDFFPLVSVFFVALLITFPYLSDFSEAAEYRVVQKDKINIRSGPGTNFEVLWEVFEGYPLQVIKRQGEWAQITDFEGDKGWISNALLVDKKNVIVKTDIANIRSGPGPNNEIVATAKYGVILSYLGQKGEWVNVKHVNGTSGWIQTALIWPNYK